ncbi:UvrD-helicase domain-containing protein [Intestinimonas butyriciproducens]|uniref:UvrD-helicase domain-containing protein n=1 Tax=Intestinimonas butyriciproducens TaxID=1297617 RepID=UPI0018AC8667|nr:UvrD-helicase domain-containing protein [Intestinimonas butyriciproducens]
MKYILFEQSAAQEIVTKVELQSFEYELSKHFIAFIREENDSFKMNGIIADKQRNGIIFAGPGLYKKIMVIDLEQCHIREEASDTELLLILQKLLRFAIRYWNQQSFTSAENIVDDKAVIFPFPYSQKKAYRVAIAREPNCHRLQIRGISFSLLAYKYNDRGAPKGVEIPDLEVYQKAGEMYLDQIHDYKKLFEISLPSSPNVSPNVNAMHLVEAKTLSPNLAFNYMTLAQQRVRLTDSQKRVVDLEDITAPIRIEGPAGTGKTVSLIMRAAVLLANARERNIPFRVAFFAHSKTTENSIRLIFNSTTNGQWINDDNQSIEITTLQEYCAKYINLNETRIIDGDAYEAKQYQLLIIQDIYTKISSQYYKTYRPHLSEELKNILDNEDVTRIVSLLQHEFSIQIKGYSAEDFDVYKTLSALSNGLPVITEDDKTYIYKLFTEYQNYLKREYVFDTDDVVLEAIFRFRGPLWKRERLQNGYDYIFVDEMHLFNANEQQAFHYLTKKINQESIPICFALDYSQAIGDIGDISNNYIEREFPAGSVIAQEYNTVFRSSQQIAELCASITASGAALFNAFINPYKAASSGFTAREDSFCRHPKLYMYNSDREMLSSLKSHIDDMIKTFQCNPNEIAVIVFGTSEIDAGLISENSGHPVIELISKNNAAENTREKGCIVLSTPENINGLEFNGVILVGVDEGRVPVTSQNDISENFMRFKALNQLYLACSRARFQVRMIGNLSRGVSSCLNYSLENGTLTK